jgi:hypothetical protein
MSEIVENECSGLNGSNPLHYLASLGLFRLLCLHDADAKMSWKQGEAWHPAFTTILDRETLCDAIARDFGWDPSETMACKGKKRSKKSNKKETAKIENEITDPRLKRLEELFPAVCGNDIISRPVADFRSLALLAANESQIWPNALRIQSELVSAFACDAIAKKGEVAFTPLSFSNRGAQQFLLKDFMEKIAFKITKEKLCNFIFYSLEQLEEGSSLNWDPLDHRDHAYRWKKPMDEPKKTNVAANALAFLGLCFYPVAPENNSLSTAGFEKHTNIFSWPIWHEYCTLDVVRCVLQQGYEGYSKFNANIFQCTRITINKNRYFFTPSVPVMLKGQ